MAQPVPQSPFCVAIDAVFQGWTALQLAVTHSFGGPHTRAKAIWFIEATEQWFSENSDIDPYELEDFLAEIMSSEFNSVVDDNSLAEVATKICKYYGMIQAGKMDELTQSLSTLKKAAGVSESQHTQDDSDGDEDDMDINDANVMNHMNALDLSQSSAEASGPGQSTDESTMSTEPSSNQTTEADNKPAEEDDGWTTVAKGGGRRKKGR